MKARNFLPSFFGGQKWRQEISCPHSLAARNEGNKFIALILWRLEMKAINSLPSFFVGQKWRQEISCPDFFGGQKWGQEISCPHSLSARNEGRKFLAPILCLKWRQEMFGLHFWPPKNEENEFHAPFLLCQTQQRFDSSDGKGGILKERQVCWWCWSMARSRFQIKQLQERCMETSSCTVNSHCLFVIHKGWPAYVFTAVLVVYSLCRVKAPNHCATCNCSRCNCSMEILSSQTLVEMKFSCCTWQWPS